MIILGGEILPQELLLSSSKYLPAIKAMQGETRAVWEQGSNWKWVRLQGAVNREASFFSYLTKRTKRMGLEKSQEDFQATRLVPGSSLPG